MILQEQLSRIRTLSGLTEAVATPHFTDRVFDRLKSPYSNFSQEKPELQALVTKNLQELQRIGFPGQHNIGVMIFKGAMEYTYHRQVNGKVEHSEGPFIWVVIRANDLETIVFGDANYLPKNTQLTFTLKKLTEYIAANGGNYTLTEKDLHKLTLKPQAAPAAAPKEQQPVIVMNGSKWLVDVKNEVLIQKNNPAKVVKILDVIDSLDPQVQDQILSMVA